MNALLAPLPPPTERQPRGFAAPCWIAPTELLRMALRSSLDQTCRPIGIRLWTCEDGNLVALRALDGQHDVFEQPCRCSCINGRRGGPCLHQAAVAVALYGRYWRAGSLHADFSQLRVAVLADRTIVDLFGGWWPALTTSDTPDRTHDYA